MNKQSTIPSDELLRVGVVTVSDRAAQGVYADESGPAIERWLARALITPWEAERMLVPDEQPEIEAALVHLVDEVGCGLVLTTGGTGPAPRDVTPEATLAIAHKVLPGFGERMRQISLAYVPTAILSRQVGVTRGQSLLVNLPGKPKSIHEILDELFASIPYCIELLGGPYVDTDPEVVVAFRPGKKARAVEPSP
ncbi:MAG: molybdopterin adenylyltransferase [Myxococcota bacterium]